MPAESAAATLEVLRDGSLFQWYVIPLLLVVLYVYANEVQKRDWNVVLAGLAFWGMDWFNEIWNGLVLHFTGFAPCWGLAKPMAYVILVGLNIEICFMFALMGLVAVKTLPADKSMKIWGIPNRWFFATVASILCVFVEVLLNQAGALVWEYTWWNAKAPYLIFLLGYLPFYLTAYWVYDMEKLSSKVKTVGAIFAFDIICLVVFAGFLKWI